MDPVTAFGIGALIGLAVGAICGYVIGFEKACRIHNGEG